MATDGVLWRSCKAPYASALSRSVKVTEPAAALVHAQEAGLNAVKTVVSLDVSAYRAQAEAHIQETGELLPGVETPPEYETHRITLGKTAD